MHSRMALMPYVNGKMGYTVWKKLVVSSTGYKPVAPGICTNTKMTHRPLPTCCSVVESVY